MVRDMHHPPSTTILGDTHTLSHRYCPECKTNAGEVIQAGEKMRLTKKKANMQSKKGNCQRDWGKV